MEFYVLFEKMLQQLNAMPVADVEKVKPVVGQICQMLRVAKITSTSYANRRLEELDRGEVLIAYDSGVPCREIFNKRIVTQMMTIICCRVYMPEGAAPWTEREKEQLDLLINTTIVYVSRGRIQEVAERYAFLDDDGYHNLRYFIRQLHIFGQSGRLPGMAAMNFNLKHFSLVNQQVGRRSGSLVMLSFFRQVEDIVGQNGAVARMGGDNFVVLCQGDRLEQLLEFLAGTAIVYDFETGDRIMVSATAGIYLIPEGFVFSDVGDILDKIIAAMAAARNNGKEDVVYFSEEMKAQKEKMSRMQRVFPEALRREEFLVYYQPKINITTGELIGAEALCRWSHDGRIIAPGEFIPLLESGLDICKLDFYMLDHVCRDLRRWLDEGRKAVRVSVNLSRKHMLDIDLLKHLLEIVDRNCVPHEYIEVELTETTTDVEFRDLKRVVRGLQKQGICTSVDDFGMGYSSLNLLKEIPWNVLKIDRSFLPVATDSATSVRSVMFRNVVAMAQELGLECIAEGVETEAQVEILRANNCPLAQGFFFDKPLPVKDFEERLDRGSYEVN
ncbi:MAG: GGDEF domain-containing protein [Ruminococcus sp.]|nr:GGDEF domain-containing protein [Ruminococcus sp.]